MRLIPVNSVKEGSELGKTIFDTSGRVLLAKGIVLSSNLLKRVKDNGIMSVYINDEYSTNEIEDIIKPDLRQKAKKIVKDSFNNIFEIAGKNTMSPVKAKKLSDQYFENINSLVNIIVDEIHSQRDLLIKMVDIKTLDDYTYEHCVNVAILSLIIGIELKFNKDKLYDLAIGAILHDLGKTYIPKEILLKTSELNEDEFTLIKHHSYKGYEYLKENMNVSSVSRIIVLQHHEKVDGTGYPNGLTGDEINDCSKVVSVADIYDALTSDRPYRPAKSPNEALEFLMGGSGTYFDYEVVKAFIKRVVPYPEGTMVKLSNGQVGIIEEINPKFTLRPKIRIIKDKGKLVNDKYIDLFEEKSVTIIGVQYNVDE